MMPVRVSVLVHGVVRDGGWFKTVTTKRYIQGVRTRG